MNKEIKKQDGFKTGTGVFKCEDCGKMTRALNWQDMNTSCCGNCEERQMHENTHADNNFINDDCGDRNCPVKYFPKEKRWWSK